MLEVILDTETTGLSTAEKHKIVEIGCLELNDQIPTKNIFHTYINPERTVSEDAYKVHGYTNKFLSNQKTFAEISDQFLNFIKDKKLVIHNAEFDIAHLNNELEIVGKKKIEKKNIIDTLDIARDKFPGSQISLDALCKRYKIDNSKRTKHTALIDCELLTKVYINLLDQKEPSLNFEINNENNNVNLNLSNNYSKKIIKPTEEEIYLHKNFLKNYLNKNYFN